VYSLKCRQHLYHFKAIFLLDSFSNLSINFSHDNVMKVGKYTAHWRGWLERFFVFAPSTEMIEIFT
jgi:hypothetical protein